MSSLRVLLALATINDYFIHQMDVTTAFLYGELKEEIYINQPKSFVTTGNEGKVCRLLKSLYGLKQAPRVWYEKLNNHLLYNGYIKCISDTNVYIKRFKSFIILIGLYVDDLILISNDLPFLNAHKQLLSSSFSMTDNLDLSYILGIQVSRDRTKKELYLSQTKYINDILLKFNMASCKQIHTVRDTRTQEQEQENKNKDMNKDKNKKCNSTQEWFSRKYIELNR